MHLFETVRYDFERGAEPLLERCLQLFIDGRAHLVELLAAFAAYRFKFLFDGACEIGETIADFLSQRDRVFSSKWILRRQNTSRGCVLE